MTKTIIIKDGKKEILKVKCIDYLLILSDPEKLKGICVKSSNNSIPRQMGWVLWVLEQLKWKAGLCFNTEPICPVKDSKEK